MVALIKEVALTLLPAWYIARRAYTVDVIGRVLLARADASHGA